MTIAGARRRKDALFASAAFAGLFAAAPAFAQHPGHDMNMAQPMAMPPAPAPATPAAPAPGRSGQDEPMSGMDMSGDIVVADYKMPWGAYGPYPMSREASGTSWQPDASPHAGLHAMRGGWMLMAHGLVNTVYDWQQGPRGAEKAFVSGMAMGSARRDFADNSTLQFRAMLSPDPAMGKRGYPLLLASGETADGLVPLVDRQHPHDLFMELSASYSLRLSGSASLFLYGGLPGEPAFGPPAFMHRLSILDSPEAPITHHWLDSTHIVFGLVTAGLVLGRIKLDASRFNGREPDQNRWDIETGPLDSSSVRLSWNPTGELALQASWGHFVSPEQLAPGENQTRWSASAIYTHPVGPGGYWSTTLAWGRRSADHRDLDAVALETALRRGSWTLFARGEWTENDELTSTGGHHGPTYSVGKASLGFVRDFPLADHLSFGAGGLISTNVVPKALEPHYSGEPSGAMAFFRLKLE